MTAEHVRCFLGIPVTHTESLQTLVAALQSRVPTFRGTRPEQWHITLAFMPHLPVDELPLLIERCTQVLAGQPACHVQLSHCGVFPSVRRPSVLWLGVEPAEPVQELYRLLRPCVPAEPTEPFLPHVTIARRRPGPWNSRQQELLQRLLDQPLPPQEFPITQVILYQSQLTQEGAVYQQLHVWPLS